MLDKKRYMLEKIADTKEWKDNGCQRLVWIQLAWEKGWIPKPELNKERIKNETSINSMDNNSLCLSDGGLARKKGRT